MIGSGEGRKRKPGRKAIRLPMKTVEKKIAAGVKLMQIAKDLGICRSTLYRKLLEYRAAQKQTETPAAEPEALT